MTARLARLAALLLLAGCEAATHPGTAIVPPPAPAVVAAGAAKACGGAADSLPVTTDRGIGGTGIGNGATLADRGIGGTGIAPGSGIGTFSPGTLRGVRTAERGGGGTGIVGVITGFPGLCIDGLAVALDRPMRVAVDGSERASATLYLGEVAAVEATGPEDHLHALSIGIRHEVSGPVTAVDASGMAIEVAGQYVLLTRQTRLTVVPHAGDWVAVSGLRDPAGTIRASRVDARPPGEVEVAGVPRRVDNSWQIGSLRLLLPPKLIPGADRLVVTGDYAAGTLRVRDASTDPLVPAGGGKRHLVVEGYPSVAGNQIRLANGLAADVGPAFGAAPPTDQPVILELVSAPDGALLAVSWHEARSGGGGADHGKPAPQEAAPPAAADPAPPPASPGSVLQSPGTAPTITTAAAATAVAAATTVAAATAATSSSPVSDTASPPAPTTPGGANGAGSSPSVSGSSTPPSVPPAPAARTPPTTTNEAHRAAPSAPTVSPRGKAGGGTAPAGGSGTIPGTTTVTRGSTTTISGVPPASAGGKSGRSGGVTPVGAAPATPGAAATAGSP